MRREVGRRGPGSAGLELGLEIVERHHQDGEDGHQEGEQRQEHRQCSE